MQPCPQILLTYDHEMLNVQHQEEANEGDEDLLHTKRYNR